jgi:hypothetical protein
VRPETAQDKNPEVTYLKIYHRTTYRRSSKRSRGACVQAYSNTYTHTYIHTYTHTYIHTYIHAYIRMIHTYTGVEASGPEDLASRHVIVWYMCAGVLVC